LTNITQIRVTGESPYDVVVGAGVVGELAGRLPADTSRVAVIFPSAQRRRGAAIRGELASRGLQVVLVEVPDGEQAKTAEVAADCWQRLGQAGLTRSDAVVGVGGGATTDLAGFVAATFLRGIALVQVPTTLLGMVDAAVGGKTGINTAEGKNLVGAFHEPVAVLCDPDALQTLPPAEMASGLAEVVKCGFIADPEILRIVEADPQAAADPAAAANRELIERAIAVKAAAVSTDLREATSTGSTVGREALNYGHTFGHAVERVERYSFRHGAAVSIGMVYVAELARLSGRLGSDTADRHGAVLESVGLPTTYRPGRWAQLHEAMRVDKKARGDRLRFVVLEGIGRPAVLEAPDSALLTAAYRRISKEAGPADSSAGAARQD